MAKTRTSFQKGQVGNPKGRKPLPDDIKYARNMSYEDMCRTVIEVRAMTPEQVKRLDSDKEPLGKRAILNAYVKLDYRGIKDYEDRLWGKAKESHEVTGSYLFDDMEIKIEIVDAKDPT